MNNYEIMFIVRSTIEKDVVDSVVTSLKKVITEQKGTIENFKELGQKQLAYPIKNEVNGYYYVLTVNAKANTVAEFDRKALIEETIIRHLIINLDKE